MQVLPGTMLASVVSDSPCAAMETPLRDVVLQVEDDDCVAGLVARILSRAGHRVLRARDGAECELLFASHAHEIALVMLDYRLPDTDGGSLCRRLRARRPGLPVMFTSGEQGARQHAFADRHTVFVAKPFLPTDISREVGALIADIA